MTVSDHQKSAKSQNILGTSGTPVFPRVEEPPYLTSPQNDSLKLLESHKQVKSVAYDRHHHNEIRKKTKMETLDLSSDDEDSVSSRQTLTSTPVYRKLLHRLETSETVLKEIKDGRRIGFYMIKKSISSGNFSEVKLAIHSLTKEQVALKLINLSHLEAKTQRLLAREAANMARIEHPHVIRFYDSQLYDNATKRYIAMEYAPGGELYTKINKTGRYHERDARIFYAQIVSAVDYMHSCNIIHRDIKAENIYFTSPRTVKLGDFGFSIRVNSTSESLNTYCGSPPYAAPELFTDEVYKGPPVDVWALGIILYLMVVGIMPFRADNVKKLRELIKNLNYTIPDILSKECKTLIKGILVKSPSERYSIYDIKTCAWLDEAEIPRPYPLLFNKRNDPSQHAIQRRNSYSAIQPGKQCQRIISNEDYAVVYRQMHKLGIDSHDIDSAASEKQISSPHVLATFLILKHKVQKKRLGEGSSTNLHNSFGGSMGSLPTSRFHEEDDQLLRTRRDDESDQGNINPTPGNLAPFKNGYRQNSVPNIPSKQSKLCTIL